MSKIKEIGRQFMERTRFKYLGISEQAAGLKQPPLEKEFDENQKFISLPNPREVEIKEISLREAIDNRVSHRSFSKAPMTLEELSFLLWCTQGIKKIAPGTATFRTVPSAGARHAFETYLLLNNVREVPPGLYRFSALHHMLAEINLEPALREDIHQACLRQSFIKESGATFIWSAVSRRMKWRYGERGYRYLHLDAGHVCQNLYLSAEAVDCGACAVAAFMDEEMNEILNLDGEEEFVIYLAAVGKTG